MRDVVARICSIPGELKVIGNASIIELILASGYLGHEESVTQEAIMSCLLANPALIETWEIYSLDKRSSPGWYLMHDEKVWNVGYINKGIKENERHFASAPEACAVFIINELKQIAKGAS
jgi:hypothetical protein